MKKVDWESRVLVPLLKAVGLTLAVFAMSLVLYSIQASYNIWILDLHDSKWGSEWGNLRFAIEFYSFMVAVPCGILFVGNTIAAIALGTAFTPIPIIIGGVFAVTYNVLIRFQKGISIADGGVSLPFFFFGFPAVCAGIVILGTAIVVVRHRVSN